MNRIFRQAACFSALAALFCSPVCGQSGGAQTYPTKPVTVIVPFPAGGSTDIEARRHSVKMSELLGQQFVVDYKPGAASMIGTAFVAKAPGDGYTVLVVTASTPVLPAFYNNMDFDIIKDLAPVSLVSKQPLAILVPPSFPARNFAEYLAYAKANPGKINFGTSGSGSVSHLVGGWMHNASSTKATFVHYKATATLMADLFEGRLHATAATFPLAVPLIKSGKLRAIAITSNERSKAFPDLATIAEQGIPGYNYVNWLGYSAPGTTAPAIVNRLSEAYAKVAKLPDIAGPLEEQSGVAVGNTPAQFRQFMISEAAQWRKVVQDADIKPE